MARRCYVDVSRGALLVINGLCVVSQKSHGFHSPLNLGMAGLRMGELAVALVLLDVSANIEQKAKLVGIEKDYAC